MKRLPLLVRVIIRCVCRFSPTPQPGRPFAVSPWLAILGDAILSDFAFSGDLTEEPISLAADVNRDIFIAARHHLKPSALPGYDGGRARPSARLVGLDGRPIGPRS